MSACWGKKLSVVLCLHLQKKDKGSPLRDWDFFSNWGDPEPLVKENACGNKQSGDAFGWWRKNCCHLGWLHGLQVNDNLRRSLDSLQEGDTLGVLIDKKSRLHLLINGEDLGPIAQAIPARRFAVLDLYGCCEEVSIVTTDHLDRGRVCMEETNADRSSSKIL